MKIPWQLLLLFYASGVYICFLLYGVLVEDVERAKYGPNKEAFHFWLFTAMVGSVFNCIVAYAALRFSHSRKDALDVSVPQSKWAIIAVMQSAATASSLMSLDYLDFPTQTLGKCGKPISILVAGLVFFRGKGSHYGVKKSVTALLVCVGIAVFMLAKPGAAKGAAAVAEDFKWIGYLLILTSLACDGIIGGLQKQLGEPGATAPTATTTTTTKKPHPYQMMFFINMWSIALMLVIELVNGNAFRAASFLARFPLAVAPLVGMSLCIAFGQLFIYKLLHDFDPLVCSLTTTTRKFFSILASVIVYGSTVTGAQWVGVALVFAGLLAPELQELYVHYFGAGAKKPVKAE